MLDEILGAESQPEEEQPLPIPGTVRIGDGALNKAQLICDLVRKVHGIPMEWYGFMVSKKDNPDTVIDIVIGHQESNAAHTQMDGAAISEVSHHVQTTMPDTIITGWIHSHADFATVFSGTDLHNMKTVLNSVYLNTRTPTHSPFRLVEGDMTITHDPDTRDVTFVGSLDTDIDVQVRGIHAEDFNAITLRAWQPVLVGWSSSIVVNENGDHAGHVNYKKELPLGKDIEFGDYETTVEVIAGMTLPLDARALENEVRKFIKKPFRTHFIRQGRHGKLFAPLSYIEGMCEGSAYGDITAKDFRGEEYDEAAVDAPAVAVPAPVTGKGFVYDALRFTGQSFNPRDQTLLLCLLNTITGQETEKNRPVEHSIYDILLTPGIDAAIESRMEQDPAFKHMAAAFKHGYYFQKMDVLTAYLTQQLDDGSRQI